MIAILGGALPSDALRLDLSSWLGLVAALAATLWAIYFVARRGRNARTFKKALLPAAAGLLVALGAAWGFFHNGKNVVRRSQLSRVEILGAPAILGAEDVAKVTGPAPRLLISATDRRKVGSETNGNLFLLDPARRYEPLAPLALEGRDGCSFRPHGIDVVEEGGTFWVFVINHHLAQDTDPERGCQPALHAPAQPMESVEIYKYQGPNRPLLFIERLQDPLLGHANDLAAAGRRHLFVTVPNTSLLEIWNMFRGHCTGRVVEWTQGSWRLRADDLCLPNGIAVQPADNGEPAAPPPQDTGRAVWVATSLDRQLHRLPKLPRPLSFGTSSPDNLSWEGGDLLVALSADGMQLVAAGLSADLNGPPIASPGCVVRLRAPESSAPAATLPTCPAEEAKATPDVLYRGNGERMSAVSSAVCIGRDLYLGQIFERGVGRVEGGCPLTPGAASPP